MEIYNHLQLSDSEAESSSDEMCLPRNTQQINNKKYNDLRKKRCLDGLPQSGRATFSDNFQAVTTMQTVQAEKGDRFIQEIFSSVGKVPSIVLFTDRIIDTIKQICCSGDEPSVLGVDRTFNLGDVYVTVTSFKHTGLLRARSAEHPIIFGPMLLHGTATTKVYRAFLSSIADALGTGHQPRLVIGSDEETALRNAIKETFPVSKNVLCTRHLKKQYG